MEACSNPVIIGGCPRSGTTALWNALTQHPALGPASDRWQDKELWFFVEYFRGRDEQYVAHRNHGLDHIFATEAVGFINGFLTRYCSSPSGRYVTAHPDNILYAEHILSRLPGVRFLFVVRHPQENVWSMLNAPFAVAAGWRRGEQETIARQDVVLATNYWKGSARRVIDALQGKFGKSVMVIRQEDMVSRPIQLMRDVLEFIGEPFAEIVAETLAHRIVNSSFAPADRAWQVNSDQERDAYFARARRAVAASPEICSVVSELAVDEMQLLGYEDYASAPEQFGVAVSVPAVAKPDSEPKAIVKLKDAFLVGPDGNRQSAFSPEEVVTLRVIVEAVERVANLSISFVVVDSQEKMMFGTTTFDEYVPLPELITGDKLEVSFRFNQVLPPGPYRIDVSVNSVSNRGYLDSIVHHQLQGACQLEAISSPRRPIHYQFHNPVLVEYGRA